MSKMQEAREKWWVENGGQFYPVASSNALAAHMWNAAIEAAAKDLKDTAAKYRANAEAIDVPVIATEAANLLDQRAVAILALREPLP